MQLTNFIVCSHFRGGLVTWKPVNSSVEFPVDTVEVLITARFYWRIDYSAETYCDENSIKNKKLIGDYGNFYSSDGVWNFDTLVYCTDYSMVDSWSGGERTQIVKVSTLYPVSATYSSCCWIYLNAGGGSWIVKVNMDLKKRDDTKQINSSPITSMPPIVRLTKNCNQTIRIPVNDADGDIVRCRWSEYSKGECSGVCQTVTNSILDSDECTLFFNPENTGYYAASIQIEDFTDSLSKEPLSSVPLKFLFLVSEGNCTETYLNSIHFVDDTLQDESCVGISFDRSFQQSILIFSDSEVIELTSQSPTGLVKSKIENYEKNLYRINITYTPQTGEFGSSLFCFKGVNSKGFSTERRCITFVIGGEIPELNGPWPTGTILPNVTTWSISSNIKIAKTTRKSFIRIFHLNTHQLIKKIDAFSNQLILVNDFTFSFKMSAYNFIEKESYYIQIDDGVVVSTEYCGIESLAIQNESFWQFKIKDITPPLVTFTSVFQTSGNSCLIEWSVNEESNVTCTLSIPNGTIRSVLCQNNSAVLYNLTQGWHTLFIEAQDLEKNQAPAKSFSWYVDLTPPLLEFLSKPALALNSDNVYFSYRCTNEIFGCIFRCFLNNVSLTSCTDYMILPTNVENDYNFTVYAIDQANNKGPSLSNFFYIDKTAPYLLNKKNLTLKCGDPISNSSYPQAFDNRDPRPFLTYLDLPQNDSCSVIRVWLAKDSAGNTAYFNQTIFFSYSKMPIVTAPLEIIVPCESVEDVTKNLNNLKLNVKQECNIYLDVVFIDSAEITMCDVTIIRNWYFFILINRIYHNTLINNGS